MSSLIEFPDPLTHRYPMWIQAGEYYYPGEGIVHLGGDMTVENLRNAYRKGIFPWFTPGLPLPWHCPDPRAVLFFDELHIPRSLSKVRRTAKYSYTIDKDFASVMLGCAEAKRNDSGGTWITQDFIDRFNELHNTGDAHSVEAWNENGELVGGLYGVDAGGVFCGESMFFRESNASKLALLYLVDHLSDKGCKWLDVQVMTPHFKVLGAREIPREFFLKMLGETQSINSRIF